MSVSSGLARQYLTKLVYYRCFQCGKKEFFFFFDWRKTCFCLPFQEILGRSIVHIRGQFFRAHECKDLLPQLHHGNDHLAVLDEPRGRVLSVADCPYDCNRLPTNRIKKTFFFPFLLVINQQGTWWGASGATFEKPNWIRSCGRRMTS